MGEEEEWVKEAMKDESIVAELLIRFKHLEELESESAKAIMVAEKKTSILQMTPLEWGIRQPRSRQVIRFNNNNNILQIKKEGESTRASPTTPLSWSCGGTSVSGGCGGADTFCGGDGYEDSSKLFKRSNTTAGRSKINGTNEPNNRRSRKKKTFAELKEEENLMLKERFHLKKELATLRISCEEHKAKNNQLKRIKIDLQHQSRNQSIVAGASKEVFYINQPCSTKEIVDQTPTMLSMLMVGTSHDAGVAVCQSTLTITTEPSTERRDTETRQSFFELPDLNVSLEEDSGSEVLYGMS